MRLHFGFSSSRICGVLGFVALCHATPLGAAPMGVATMINEASDEPASLLCADGECAPRITQVQFGGRDAYRLTDGKSAAIIVPSLGRVMSFGLVDGPNWLFNGAKGKAKIGDWVNWGGDKSWPAPQSAWSLWQSSGGWPPPLSWDGKPHQAEVLTGGKVRMSSGVQPGLNARVVRTFSYNDKGEFVIEQMMEKVKGDPQQISIWSITQINHPDAIFLPTNPDSPYKNNFHWIGRESGDANSATTVSPTLLRVAPSKVGSYKIGVDAPITAIAAVKNGMALVERASHPKGDYPDGATGGAGFGVELYNNGNPAYDELELLSPLLLAKAGSHWTYTVRWSLHQLPDTDATSPAVEAAIEKLFAAN